MKKHLSRNWLVVSGFVLLGMSPCFLHSTRQERLSVGESQQQQDQAGMILPLAQKAQNNEVLLTPARWGAVWEQA